MNADFEMDMNDSLDRPRVSNAAVLPVSTRTRTEGEFFSDSNGKSAYRGDHGKKGNLGYPS